MHSFSTLTRAFDRLDKWLGTAAPNHFLTADQKFGA